MVQQLLGQRGEQVHLEVLVEDASGAMVVEGLLGKIVSEVETEISYRFHPYKGIGELPAGLAGKTDPSKRILLDQLPRLLRGYGRVPGAIVILVVDLDDNDRASFLQELDQLLAGCRPAPQAVFCFAVEEIEAWLLGDPAAVKSAYPTAKHLERYVQDSICGTWEFLADAIYPGGCAKLKKLGWPHIGQAKCSWAQTITPKIDVHRNHSPSFQEFRARISALVATS